MRALTNCKIEYVPIEKEFLGIVIAVKKCNNFVWP